MRDTPVQQQYQQYIKCKIAYRYTGNQQISNSYHVDNEKAEGQKSVRTYLAYCQCLYRIFLFQRQLARVSQILHRNQAPPTSQTLFRDPRHDLLFAHGSHHVHSRPRTQHHRILIKTDRILPGLIRRHYYTSQRNMKAKIDLLLLNIHKNFQVYVSYLFRIYCCRHHTIRYRIQVVKDLIVRDRLNDCFISKEQ